MKQLLNASINLFFSTANFRGKHIIATRLGAFMPEDVYTSHYGVRMVSNFADKTWIFSMVGAYGSFTASHLHDLQAEFSFIDIGANQGLFSCLALKNPKCASVVAFEPNRTLIQRLESNIKMANSRERSVTIFEKAIMNEAMTDAVLEYPEGHSGKAVVREGAEGTATVQIIDPKELSRVFSRCPGKIHVKIDVEGAEVSVLNALDSSKVLDRIETIVVESSDATGGAMHSDHIHEFLTERGWKLLKKSKPTGHCDCLYSNVQS